MRSAYWSHPGDDLKALMATVRAYGSIRALLCALWQAGLILDHPPERWSSAQEPLRELMAAIRQHWGSIAAFLIEIQTAAIVGEGIRPCRDQN
ncbi:hypothetical protein SAMN00768000_0255 [Sulfobacillus thermosulfidooxidans DSM 9293]|uniref:Uncharacterized protein n=2 Tax=Sulfobacillus thermosulfidooxidans TaxID=28034 RepID=A0A1W1W6Y1_SULTA|nr:hypothetical protein [Sulfobacillus thermosulfidooxidans]PSR20936.1 MAG: hypothetical protein C7B47_17630 [Sulfobacillus thermosulfidooxidans]SMC02044.1 hypothetical protein SAMN00768000_0255 [Sulfobacillus thermosulfidooxidans DSM 9293]